MTFPISTAAALKNLLFSCEPPPHKALTYLKSLKIGNIGLDYMNILCFHVSKTLGVVFCPDNGENCVFWICA